MSLTRKDIQEALLAYDVMAQKEHGWKRWLPFFSQFFKDPIEIEELRKFVANNVSDESELVNQQDYITLVLTLLEIGFRSTLMGLPDSVYRCFDSGDLLMKAMGECGKEKMKALDILYGQGLLQEREFAEKNISNIAKFSIFSNEINLDLTKRINMRYKKEEFLKQEDVDEILEQHRGLTV